MKFKFILTAVVLSVLAGCAGAPVAPEFDGIGSFKGVKWGMSRDKVEVVANRDLKKMDNMKSYAGDVMYGMPCKITFDFGYRDALRAVTVDYDVINPDAEYAYVIKKITDIFGKPKKNSRQAGVVWHSPDTAAVLLLSGGDEKEMKLTFVRKEKQ